MSEPGKLKVDDILRTVADYYGVECEGVMSKSKSRTLTLARHVAMFLARTFTEYSLPEIGRRFDRDHTVVLHGVRRIEALLQSDEKLRADIELLSAQFSLRRVA